MTIAPSLHDQLLALERRLLQPDVRRSPEELASLLADDFREFGGSGAVWNKPSIIASLQDESDCRWELRDFALAVLSPDVALVTYRVTRTVIETDERVESLRSSIWVKRNSRWQMLFHQGTRI